MNDNFGMMDEGYFVPRKEIIDWINKLLKVNIDKIEQLGSGSIYCQILDAIYPGDVQMSKVNWKAKLEYEFINNLKILQNAFTKKQINRKIEIERLAKARYQDNLEFIQWLKRYYDIKIGDKDGTYNAEERRGGVPVDFTFANKIIQPKSFKNINNVPEIYSFQPKENKKPQAQQQQASSENKPQTASKISQQTGTTTNTMTKKTTQQSSNTMQSNFNKFVNQKKKSVNAKTNTTTKASSDQLLSDVKRILNEEGKTDNQIIRSLKILLNMENGSGNKELSDKTNLQQQSQQQSDLLMMNKILPDDMNISHNNNNLNEEMQDKQDMAELVDILNSNNPEQIQKQIKTN